MLANAVAPNADASVAVFSIDDIPNRMGAAMDPLAVHDPNPGEEPTGTRRLSRRAWLALAGAAGLASLGGWSLIAGIRSPDPRWTAPLPTARAVVGAADDSALYAYVPNDQGAAALLALDSTTGAERWNARLDSPSNGPMAMIPAGDALVIGTGDTVSAHDTATGRLRWQVRRSGWTKSMSITPRGRTMRPAAVDVANGLVVFRSSYRTDTVDLRTGDLIWSSDLTLPDTTLVSSADVAAHNGMCFSVNAHMLKPERGLFHRTWIDAWDLRTGQVLWSTEFESGSSFDAWVRAAGDLVVARDSGSIVVVDAATGHRRWDGLQGRSVIVGDVLVRIYENGGSAEVHGLDLADGTKRWSLTDLDASDEDAKNAVVHLVGGDGMVYVEEPDEPPVALDAASGAKLWTYRGQRHYTTATVIAAHGRDVYLAAGGQVEAITTT